jgi:hypothetical protein
VDVEQRGRAVGRASPAPRERAATTPANALPRPDASSEQEIATLRERVASLEREVRLRDGALAERETEIRGLYARIAQQDQEIRGLSIRKSTARRLTDSH